MRPPALAGVDARNSSLREKESGDSSAVASMILMTSSVNFRIDCTMTFHPHCCATSTDENKAEAKQCASLDDLYEVVISSNKNACCDRNASFFCHSHHLLASCDFSPSGYCPKKGTRDATSYCRAKWTRVWCPSAFDMFVIVTRPE
eukprot:scaffold22_cov93-Cylindrotheca_fusiformis.AAC.5